jgi:hypothetical protein
VWSGPLLKRATDARNQATLPGGTSRGTGGTGAESEVMPES